MDTMKFSIRQNRQFMNTSAVIIYDDQYLKIYASVKYGNNNSLLHYYREKEISRLTVCCI